MLIISVLCVDNIFALCFSDRQRAREGSEREREVDHPAGDRGEQAVRHQGGAGQSGQQPALPVRPGRPDPLQPAAQGGTEAQRRVRVPDGPAGRARVPG